MSQSSAAPRRPRLQPAPSAGGAERADRLVTDEAGFLPPPAPHDLDDIDEADDWLGEPFDRWAALLFILLLGLMAFVGLTAVAGAPALSPDARLVGLIGPAFGLVVLVATVRGLSLGRPWAHISAAAILVVLVTQGIVGFVVGLPIGRIEIPLAAIAAVIVLGRLPQAGIEPPALARDRRIACALASLAGPLGRLAADRRDDPHTRPHAALGGT